MQFSIDTLAFSTHRVRTVSGRPQTNSAGALVHCGSHYTTIDPDQTLAQLGARGWTCERHVGRNQFRQHIVVDAPAGLLAPTGYRFRAGIQFDHAGRRGVRIVPIAERLYCANQFNGAWLSIPHRGPAARAFLTNPEPFVTAAFESAPALLGRLRSLENTFAGELWDWLRSVKPRLYRQAHTALDPETKNYYCAVVSVANFLQALTATRSPSLAALAQLALTRDFAEMAVGKVPAAWLN